MKTIKLNKKEFQMVWDAVGFWGSDGFTKAERKTWESIFEKLKKAEREEE